MSTQMLPVKEWGKLLYDQTITEEECSKKASEKSDEQELKLIVPRPPESGLLFLSFVPERVCAQDDFAILSLVEEIHSPPPNC